MIEQLYIDQLRNLSDVKITTGRCNLIIGANGSGKTSLLEAIFLLSRGKSFRHHQPKRYIQHHRLAASVHARFDDNQTLAIQKSIEAATTLKLNHTAVVGQSVITERLPTLLIDPSSMDMLEQGSASRRHLLDWLVFHMKPGFHGQWIAYQRLLKQRNNLLKQSIRLSPQQRAELTAWDKGLSHHATLIHHYRQHVFDRWQPYFYEVLTQLLPKYADHIQLRYQPGFDTQAALAEQLSDRIAQDIQAGYTRIGAHRADVHVDWRDEAVGDEQHKPIKEQAANVLSRGEKKLLITALRLSQLPLLLDPPSADQQKQAGDNEGLHSTKPEPTPVVLLDDITAELDTHAIHVLLSALATLDCQVFITSLDETAVTMVGKFWPDLRLFHVKQGKFTPQQLPAQYLPQDDD